MINDEGWLKGAEIQKSPNFDYRPENTEVNLIVIHNISLPPGEYSDTNVIKLFTNTLDFESHDYFKKINGLKVSSHFFIKRNGEIIQFVSVLDRAWHAGKSKHKGKINCNDFSIGIELSGSDDCHYEEEQYKGLMYLINELMKKFEGINLDNIVGHSEISPGRKTDPGPFFDWNRIKGNI